MAAPIDPENGPFSRQGSMGLGARSQASDTPQVQEAKGALAETGQVQPMPTEGPTESPAQTVNLSSIGAGVDRRVRLLTAAGMLGGLTFCIAVAVGLRLYLADASRDLTAEILLTEGERFTAIAWSPRNAATLLVGTSSGRLYRVRGSGTPEAVLTRAKGPIVTIFPSSGQNANERDAAASSTEPNVPDDRQSGTLDSDAYVVWLDPATDDDTPFRADEKPTLAGLAVPAGSKLLPVIDLPPTAVPNAGGVSGTRRKWLKPKLPVQTPFQAAQPNRIGIDARTADGLVSAVGTARMRDLFDLTPEASTDEAIVLGYLDGSMRVVDRSSTRPLWTLRGTTSAPTASSDPAAGRSVIAIASRLGSQQSYTAHAAFAWATANGDIRVFRRGADSNSPLIQRIEMSEAAPPIRPVEPLAVTLRPILASRDGLWLSNNGDMLMIYGHGGLALARLSDVPTGDLARILQRYQPEELAVAPVQLTSNDVVRLQRELAARGFDPGPFDGLLGPSTQLALAAFKTKYSVSDAQAVCSLQLTCPQPRISAAALFPSGEAFAIAGDDGVVRIVALPKDLRDLSNSQPLRIRGHGEVITRLSISPDNRYLASLSVDGRLRLTDITRARQVARWPLHDLRSGPDSADMAPIVLPPGVPSPGVNDPIVVLGSFNGLQLARAEVARVSASGLSGLGGPEIFRWRNSYNVILRLPDAAAQLREMIKLRSLAQWSRSAYPGRLNELCWNPEPMDGFIHCKNDAPRQPALPKIENPAQPDKSLQSR
ncbi:hypothetical protein I6F18_20000 [Bradyrhizobium sp. NBAIM32]|uniref:peptidoglycan-binding protein n=1 Tax=Bradyrhizobium sp. NBAIM32 TaxID=2793809 RepID=UPI001CD641FD|nr:peptidoglycan-binding protein [Bradyrhizobium sp. NBAIM32]MCA1542244.1 hypothetical protein [Bradyrhizobium sp. NBAIM32]